MYKVKRLSQLSLSVLLNDPKRNYRGIRRIVFYIKVLINSRAKSSNKDTDISYINDNKKIDFYSQ